MEWISVEDEKPKADGNYLVFINKRGGIYEVAWFDHEISYFWIAGAFASYITHWMPLPEPPKEK